MSKLSDTLREARELIQRAMRKLEVAKMESEEMVTRNAFLMCVKTFDLTDVAFKRSSQTKKTETRSELYNSQTGDEDEDD